jgi:hypothetical protein
MSYIGSNPITQYFLEGTDTFNVVASQSVFTLSRPTPTINSIEVITGSTLLSPTPANYSVNGASLTLGAPVSNTTVYVRYLTTSSYSIAVQNNSVTVASIAASGTPGNTNFLRGDGVWAIPGIPQNAQSAAYSLQASDSGKHIAISTGGVTINAGIFSAGQVVTIYNNSAANQSITAGVGVTIQLAGTATTGSRVLAQYGIATLLCVAANVYVASGAGLS